MARVYPFRGYRYDPEKAGPLDRLVTQPYDKISDRLLDDYLARSPYNVAHVIRNSNYQEAGTYFRSWIDQRVLRQDPSPSFYPYEQSYTYEGKEYSRLGFIGLVGLKDSDLAVRGHERVLQKPFEDRLNLIRQTESNDGLIFSLFSDPAQKVDTALSKVAGRAAPAIEVTDDFGVRNRLWLLSDPDLQRQIVDSLRTAMLYIADGHHRFETACRYREECLERGWYPEGVESFDNRMMALFNMEAPGLQILPTHRAVRNLPDLDLRVLLKQLGKYFRLSQLRDLEELDTFMATENHALGMVSRGPLTFHGLVLRDSPTGFMPQIEGKARELDVNILHQGILEPFLGIGRLELEKESHVDYYRDRKSMIDQLIEGRHELAFLLKPTRLEQVRQISELGEKMPQKSTDFYPKLLTGLVFMKMMIGGRGQ